MSLVDRIGLGGGGSLYDPQVSWWNPDFVFVACDMIGLYRSIDGGSHWTMLDTRIVQGSNRFSVAIHPTQQRILGYHPFQGVKESVDGLNWNDFSPATPLNAQMYPPVQSSLSGCSPQ
jgi:hypothetical protein